MPTTRVQTGIRFEEDTLIKITYIAKKKRRSLNGQLEILAETCIAEYEATHGEIKLTEEEQNKYRR